MEIELTSKVLDEGFKGATEDETEAARLVRQIYKDAEEKYGLKDRAVVPGVLTVQAYEAISALRKLLEAKEDGTEIMFDWARIPSFGIADGDESTNFIKKTRAVFEDLATAISEHVGCKWSVVPTASTAYEQISFH